MSTPLSSEQIKYYKNQGYLFPLDVVNNEEAIRLRGELEGVEKAQGHPLDRLQSNKSYLLYDWADELVHHPAILDAIESLIGPNILCYMTNLFTKEIGSGGYVSMHQDAAYWGVEADDVITAWVALSPATEESGVMKVQPGSHKKMLEQVNTYAKDNLLSRGQEIPAKDLDPKKNVYMELKPGQMSLHNFLLVHGSNPNNSDDRRIGFAIRYVNANANKIGNPESALLVKGKSTGNFILEKRAKNLTPAQRKKQHAQAMRRQLVNVFKAGDDASITERLRLSATKHLGVAISLWREFTAR
jgi:ectoine hydroxylase-related dioxygenase (phytanoyl-CoA dioxygenase family)